MTDLDDINEMTRTLRDISGTFRSLRRVIAGLTIAAVCAFSTGILWGAGWVQAVETSLADHDERLEVIDELNRTVGRLEGIAESLTN